MNVVVSIRKFVVGIDVLKNKIPSQKQLGGTLVLAIYPKEGESLSTIIDD